MDGAAAKHCDATKKGAHAPEGDAGLIFIPFSMEIYG
jgi:hypothetical protein